MVPRIPDHAALPFDPRRRTAPAVQRNREPILEVLKRTFPATGLVLEVASGTGEHGAFFCSHVPGLTWQPSDVDPSNLHSIVGWKEALGLDNLLTPLLIDLASPHSNLQAQYDAAFCANLIHIAPWTVCRHLMQLVGNALRPGGRLVTYGPYKVDGQHTSDSNVAFEQWLWSQSTEYGVRDLSDVVAEAQRYHLQLLQQIPMPANNFCLVFEKESPATQLTA